MILTQQRKILSYMFPLFSDTLKSWDMLTWPTTQPDTQLLNRPRRGQTVSPFDFSLHFISWMNVLIDWPVTLDKCPVPLVCVPVGDGASLFLQISVACYLSKWPGTSQETVYVTCLVQVCLWPVSNCKKRLSKQCEQLDLLTRNMNLLYILLQAAPFCSSQLSQLLRLL